MICPQVDWWEKRKRKRKKKWRLGVWRHGSHGKKKRMYYLSFLINVKIWSIIRLFVLLCALVECQCVLAYQTHTHSQDPWELITRSIHCIPKWQMLFTLNALQEGHLVGMFHWEPMTYIHASSYTTCSRLWVINYNEGKVYGRVIFKPYVSTFKRLCCNHWKYLGKDQKMYLLEDIPILLLMD